MEAYKILKYPDPRLRIKARPLLKSQIEENIPVIKNMVLTMHKAEGIGLAATQVGIDKRIVVIDTTRRTDKDKPVYLDDEEIIENNKGLIVAINPEIVSSEEKIVYEEGCLSIPDFNSDVERARKVRVRALGLSGEEVIIDAQDLLAVAFQHEIDHLNGVLFIDKVSPLKRSLYNAAIRKKEKKKDKDLTSVS